MKNETKKQTKKVAKKKTTSSKAKKEPTKKVVPTKKKTATTKKTTAVKKKATTTKKSTATAKKRTTPVKKKTTVKKENKVVSNKKEVKKTTPKVQKKKTPTRKTAVLPQNNVEQKMIIDQEPVVKQDVKVNKELDKSEKRNPFIWVLIIGIVALSLVFSIINIKKESKVTYHFSSNLEYYTANVLNLDNENDEQNNEWFNIKEDVIVYATGKNHQLSIKNNNDNSIIEIDRKKTFFKSFNLEYIAKPVNEKFEIDYIFFCPDEETTLSFTSSNDCVDIDGNIITTKKDGSATIYANYADEQVKIMEIDSSSLIVNRPAEFDNTKGFVKCEQYTNEENEVLDSILEKKINYAGYKTRAGAVEAMRFLAFDFPYKVDYFNENGRLPYVDGEGRYYHKGLYLSSGKYNDLLDPKRTNKGTWGCVIYSNPLEAYETNGVDCSGLVTWALYNDGFDPDDAKGANLLMTLGDIKNTKDALDSGKVKVGDFVHNNEAESHIGMIIGMDDYYYYVIQSIWYSPFGVCVTKYSKDEMINHWLQIILLDNYYEGDGLLTNMWY